MNVIISRNLQQAKCWATRVFIVGFTFASLLSAGCQLATQSAVDRELREIRDLLPGVYVGTSVAPWNPGQQIELTHQFAEIDAPQFGDLVYYYQLLVDGKVIQQKIFVFDTDAERRENSMGPILLPKNANQDKAHLFPVNWSKLSPADTKIFPEQCKLTWKASLKGASEFFSGPGYSASVDAQACEYESAVFNGTVKPLLRYDINSATLGWQEKLTDSEGKILTETSGLLIAQRKQAISD